MDMDGRLQTILLNGIGKIKGEIVYEGSIKIHYWKDH